MKLRLALALAALSLAHSAFAGPRFLNCDYNGGHVSIVAADGSIEWQVDAKNPQDCWLLPNGNILFAYLNGAKEMTKDKQVVWEYKAPEKIECHAAQPLPNGNVLVVEGGTSRIIEVNRKGEIAKEIKLTTTTDKMHNQFRGTRKTPEGHYLVCFKGEGKVVELDGDGKVLREVKVPGDPHEVVLLPNKNWLITCGDGHKVEEVDPSDKVVWELNENDLPGNPLRLMAGCQRLPNGNTLFCVYLGHGHIGEQSMVLEVTRDKKVVWEFADHAHFKTINQVQSLEVPGDVTKGEILR
ncbi:MAG: PQQ-binding-like beta-propeller repeat protein [Chthoniobacter sp.]|nr:PQQ-binding-like beta-propeller repeat protein [Chthoniobacter sp.]